MAINYGRKFFERVLVFRPHNVYGAEMGFEHVVPQFILRMNRLCREQNGPIRFDIQGTGKETRAFVYIDDFIDGLMCVIEKGEHLGIYHIGTTDEIAIEQLARCVGEFFGRDIEIVPGESAQGGTPRRCPDIGKILALGYRPRYSLKDGLAITAKWYVENADQAPRAQKSAPDAELAEVRNAN